MLRAPAFPRQGRIPAIQQPPRLQLADGVTALTALEPGQRDAGGSRNPGLQHYGRSHESGLIQGSHCVAGPGASKSAISSAARPAFATRRWRRRVRPGPSPEDVSIARPSSTFSPPLSRALQRRLDNCRSNQVPSASAIAPARARCADMRKPSNLISWSHCGPEGAARRAGRAGAGSNVEEVTPMANRIWRPSGRPSTGDM